MSNTALMLFFSSLLLCLAGCSPVSVSLNSSFGLSLSNQNPNEDGSSNSNLTVVDQPSFINKATEKKVVFGGSCLNLRQFQVLINQVEAARVDCIDSLWSTTIDTQLVSDGQLAFEFKNTSNSELLKTLIIRKDTIAPTAHLTGMDQGVPKKVNLRNVELVVDNFSDSIFYSYKFGRSSLIDCSNQDGYVKFIPVNKSSDLNLNNNDGTYRICLVGKDAFGNEQAYADATTYIWDLDTASPTITLKPDLNLSYVNSFTVENFTLEVSCSEESQPVIFVAMDQAGKTNTGNSVCISRTATFSFNLKNLVEGMIEFRASQSDSHGNSSGSGILATSLKDTIAPQFTSSLVNDSTEYFSNLAKTPDISWQTANDQGSGFKEFKLGIGTSISSANIISFVTVSAEARLGKALETPNPFLANTTYYALVKAIDLAGNETLIASNGWKTDTSAPTLSSFDDGIYSIPGKTPLMSWSVGASTGAPVREIQLRIGTSLGGFQIIDWTGIGSGTNISYSHAYLNRLEINKVYYATIRAIDEAGNVGTAIQGDGFVVKPSIEKIVGNDGAFAAIMTNGRVIAWGDPGYGGDIEAVPAALKDGSVIASEIVSNNNSFAVLTSAGAVYSWGALSLKGSAPISGILDGTPGLEVDTIYSNKYAFAAILKSGRVVAWGDPDKGGGDVPIELEGNDGPANYIVATSSSFAAVRGNAVFSWGDSNTGGDINFGYCKAVSSGGCASPASPESDLVNGDSTIKTVKATGQGFVVLKNDGQVINWGTFNDSLLSYIGAKVSNASNPVDEVYTNPNAVAVVRRDGSVVVWGVTSSGNLGGVLGYIEIVSNSIIDVEADLSGGPNNKVHSIFGNSSAFAAVRADKSVVTWGHYQRGGDSSSVDFGAGVKGIFSTHSAFAAILEGTDNVVAWGDSGSGGLIPDDVKLKLDGSVANKAKTIVGNRQAFAALKTDGSVVTWGNSGYGGTSKIVGGALPETDVQFSLDGSGRKVEKIYSNPWSFVAVYDDKTFVTWGDRELGGYSDAINPK